MNALRCLLLLSFLGKVHAQEEITAADGRKIAGEVLRVEANGVVFERADRRTFTIPWEALEARQALKLQTRHFVTEKTDKFDGSTRLSLKDEVVLKDGVEMDICAIVMEQREAPTIWLLNWTRIAQGWEWLKHHPVTLLVDGERWTPEPEIHTEVLDGGRVYEAVSVQLSAEQVARLVAAKTIEAKVGLREYTLSDKDRLILHMVFSAWVARGGSVKAEKAKEEALKSSAAKEDS